MLNNWWESQYDCLRCNRTGLIPVFDYAAILGIRLRPREKMFLCGCKFTKRYCNEDDIKIYEDGKSKSIHKKVNIGINFDEVFSEPQFPFSRDILELPIISGGGGKGDYQTIYLMCMHYSVRRWKETGNAIIAIDPRLRVST